MTLTLRQAAARLGKNTRQVRYLIKTGKLAARKDGHRWVIDEADLPLSQAQRRAATDKQDRLRDAVETVLNIGDGATRRRYSMRDLKAFQIALPLHADAGDLLGTDHPATLAAKEALSHLARGCHRYQRADKAAAYAAARDAASRVALELILDGREGTAPLVDQVEQELMAAMAGMLRRLDKTRRRARGDLP